MSDILSAHALAWPPLVMLLAAPGPWSRSLVDSQFSRAPWMSRWPSRRKAGSRHPPHGASWGWQSPSGLPFDWAAVICLHQTPFGAWQLAFRNGHGALDLWCSFHHRCWRSWCMSARHYRFHRGSKGSAVGQTSGDGLNMARAGWRDGVGRGNETDAADVQPPLCLRQGRSPTRQHQRVPRKPPRLLISQVKREEGCGAGAVPCRTGLKRIGGTRGAMWERKGVQG